jgi:hypothetical protein
MWTRSERALRVTIVVVALFAALKSGDPLGWAALVTALDRLTR